VFKLFEAKKAYYQGLEFLVYEDVYQPAEDSYLVADNLVVRNSEEVLDIGTGCGIIAILAARKARRVIAVDIDEVAVECAKENVKRHGLEAKVEVRLGDLFNPLHPWEKFDLIVFNPPYLPVENGIKAWSGGVNGRAVIDKFLSEVKRFLKPHGRILLLQSSLSDIEKTFTILKDLNFKFKVIASRDFFFERLVLIEAEVSSESFV